MVNAIPTANANLVGFGFGFGATVPLLATLLVPVPVLVPVGRSYRGPNRERCVNYFTLGISNIFVETIKGLYKRTPRPLPPAPRRRGMIGANEPRSFAPA